MRLYLSAQTKYNIGYTPDWIQITIPKPEKPEHTLSLTMDIQGEIGYDPESVNVRVKGDLIPWALVDSESDKEKDLSDIDDEQLNYYTNLFNNNLETATEVVIGLYPIDEDKYDNLESAVKFTECEGEYEFVDKNDGYKSISFKFDVEVNL